jgi:hypothetical protein
MSHRNDLYVLALLNGVIFLSAELVGDGTFFYQTGLIQAFAIPFIILALTRIVAVKAIHDPTLKRMVQGCLLAILVFAESHVIGFFSRIFFRIGEEAMLVNVANLYLAGLLLFIIGTQFVLRVRSAERSSLVIGASTFMLLFLSALAVVFSLDASLVSLRPSSPMPYVYGLLAAAIGFFSILSMERARRALAVLDRFWRYMIAGSAFIAASALLSIFHVFAVLRLGAPAHQVAYLNCLAFYIGMSLMFVAFGWAVPKTGIYADLAEEEAKPA